MDVTFIVDTAEAPIFVLTYPATATHEEITRLFDTFDAICRAHDSVVWVIDMRELNPLTTPPSVRKHFETEYEKHRTVIENATLAEARILGSSLTQAVVTAVDWVLGRPYKTKNFTDVEAAKRWARQLLDKKPAAKTARL